MTRFFLYIAGFLVLANIAVAIWPDRVNHAPHVYSSKEDVNPHFVRLNKEIEERFYSQVTEEVNLIEEVEEVAVVEPSAVESALEQKGCYRVGPFMHQENYDLAQAVLFNANVDYRKSKRASKESSVFRVFVGPYASEPEVSDARRALTRNKILDHFIRKQGENDYVISLGIYSSEESADSAIRLFSDKIDGVQKQGENVVLPDSYWLHFSIDDDDRVRQQLSAMDWGEPSAKMGLHTCGI